MAKSSGKIRPISYVFIAVFILLFFAQDDSQKGGVAETKVIQKQHLMKFMTITRYGRFRPERTDFLCAYYMSGRSNCLIFMKIMEKSAYVKCSILVLHWSDIGIIL